MAEKGHKSVRRSKQESLEGVRKMYSDFCGKDDPKIFSVADTFCVRYLINFRFLSGFFDEMLRIS